MVTVLILLYTKTTLALSCAPTSEKIGIISDISLKNSELNIKLKNIKSFDSSNIFKNHIFSVDEYKNIVQKYINGEKLLELPNLMDLNLEYIPKNLNVSQGDIYIKGPPFHICNYGFEGIYSSTGQLKYAIINDSFQNYNYKGKDIKIKPGKQYNCKKNLCKVHVNYSIDNEKFSLNIDQSYHPKTKHFDSITLLDSSNYNEGKNKIFDWGMGKFHNSVITFSDKPKNIRCNNAKKPSKENCKYKPIHDDKECVVNYKEICSNNSQNIFEKFLNWLKSLFP